MNVLVFGKDGQLGKAFSALIGQSSISANTQITYLGRAECDLSKEADVFAALKAAKPNLIINASAYTAVDKAETEVDLAFAVNAKAPEIMARYAAENDATLLHYSTDYVFDGSKDGLYMEDDPRNPLGVYGKSKAAGEEAIEKVFANSSKGQFAIFRTSWVYGDGGNFIRTMLRLAKDREELKVIHDQHGVPTSAEWLAQISLDLVLDQQGGLKVFPSGIYHAIPAGETTWHGLASFAVQVALNAGIELKAKPAAIKPILAVKYPLPAPRPMNSRMDRSKLRKTLENQGSMAKLGSIDEPWSIAVQDYIQALAKDGLI
uniref:dTDP-4-dehydrorhamnose reductase n=1 Tax=Polynucleobacter necessarius subsp. necessarius (strain STIR1) TaxID=452638 RepID=B1XT96_POLNS